MPCLNCRLIEMGEMACYADTCPQCHRAPPGKTTSSQQDLGEFTWSLWTWLYFLTCTSNRELLFLSISQNFDMLLSQKFQISGNLKHKRDF